MITVEEALNIINNHRKDFGSELIPLEISIGRVLRESLSTDRQLPPYHRVTMDGIAIQYAHFAAGKCAFPIAGIAPAGAEQLTLTKDGHCLEVMTGSIMPNKADTVIRYEDVLIENGVAIIQVAYSKRRAKYSLEGKRPTKRSVGSIQW